MTRDTFSPWTKETCDLRIGDEIKLIEKPSNFTVTKIYNGGIDTNSIQEIRWNELYLYFVKSDNTRCGQKTRSF